MPRRSAPPLKNYHFDGTGYVWVGPYPADAVNAQSAVARRLRGKKANLAGLAFETIVEIGLQRALECRILHRYEHRQPAFKRVGVGSKKRFVPVARSGADFGGVLDGGRALALEAKSTKQPRFYRMGIRPLQQADLTSTAEAGACALLALRFTEKRPFRMFVVPWFLVPWKRLSRAESVGPEDLVGWEFQPPDLFGEGALGRSLLGRFTDPLELTGSKD